MKKLSLLSGGERSLTALAYLFAVFRSRPSPFYVMDEVEAALDDVNLHRFLDLVAEFRQEAQLIIVSHQKRTMEAADCLYGVTMQPGGSSKVVSEKVAPAPDRRRLRRGVRRPPPGRSCATRRPGSPAAWGLDRAPSRSATAWDRVVGVDDAAHPRRARLPGQRAARPTSVA